MARWKGSLLYRDTGSGLSWSITTYGPDALADDMKSRADDWNDKYLACCHANAKLVGMIVSDIDKKGDSRFFDPSTFNTTQGGQSTGMIPVAEAILAVGSDDSPASLGRSKWYLHGIDTSCLFGDGSLNTGAAAVAALKTACASYLYQFRKTATPAWAWPVVTPPQAFTAYVMKGPYVRRLGRAFFLPGQQHRYRRGA